MWGKIISFPNDTARSHFLYLNPTISKCSFHLVFINRNIHSHTQHSARMNNFVKINFIISKLVLVNINASRSFEVPVSRSISISTVSLFSTHTRTFLILDPILSEILWDISRMYVIYVNNILVCIWGEPEYRMLMYTCVHE